MSAILLHNPEVQASIIGGLGAVATAAIAALFKLVVDRHKAYIARLERENAIASQDILFLLAVEEMHCEHRRSVEGHSAKVTVRKAVVAAGLEWSGRYTPGRVARREVNARLSHPWFGDASSTPWVIRLFLRGPDHQQSCQQQPEQSNEQLPVQF